MVAYQLVALGHPDLPTHFRYDAQTIEVLHYHLVRHLPAPFSVDGVHPTEIFRSVNPNWEMWAI
jgi:hypothetical protein